MLRVYRGLLHLYPAAYRCRFREEMLWVYQAAEKDLVEQPLPSRAGFYAREVLGLLAGAAHEHLDSLFRVSDFSPVRSRDMSPEFRFPRSTIWLMAVILVGVVLAINEAKSISLKFAAGAHVMSVWSSLQFWAVVLALVCIAGSAGWAILFALGRSGSHRLSKLPTGVMPEMQDKHPTGAS